jgi:hypothetical protein
MVRLAQQQLRSPAARDDGWTPLAHLLTSVQHLLDCWRFAIEQVPALLQVVVRTLLPLVQQLQGCSSLLLPPAVAAACNAPAANVQADSRSSSSSSSSCRHDLQRVLVETQLAVSWLLSAIDTQQELKPDAGGAAEVLRLHSEPAVAEMQLQVLTALAAQLHKQHTAQQQQQQQLLPGTARASSSSTQQQQRQLTKRQHRADLLSIPAFHQDMLQLLPGGQAYLDAAAKEAAGCGWTGEEFTLHLCAYADDCCRTINNYLYHQFQSIEGQQQISRSALVSGAAVRLVLELTLLASGAVQRQREQHRQQQQQQASTPDARTAIDDFALRTREVLGLQIRAMVATSRSCLPPEVLQQAGLQLLQALAAPLQQWQLSRIGDSSLHQAAVTGASPHVGDTLQLLVAAACGAQATPSQPAIGELYRWISGVWAATATTAAAAKLTWQAAPGM